MQMYLLFFFPLQSGTKHLQVFHLSLNVGDTVFCLYVLRLSAFHGCMGLQGMSPITEQMQYSSELESGIKSEWMKSEAPWSALLWVKKSGV